ncbi:MAG: cytochrome c [Thermodesulfobacteriota bacterium]
MKNRHVIILLSLMASLFFLPAHLLAGNEARKGGRIYQQYCTPCHGQEGNGRGPRAKNEALQPPPRDHTNGFYMNMQSDVRLFKVIKFGGKANNLSHIMPQWKHVLSDRQIFSIVLFIRSLAKDPVYEPPNMENWGKNPYAGDERGKLDKGGQVK